VLFKDTSCPQIKFLKRIFIVHAETTDVCGSDTSPGAGLGALTITKLPIFSFWHLILKFEKIRNNKSMEPLEESNWLLWNTTSGW
jgi:hypothetical protein